MINGFSQLICTSYWPEEEQLGQTKTRATLEWHVAKVQKNVRQEKEIRSPSDCQIM